MPWAQASTLRATCAILAQVSGGSWRYSLSQATCVIRVFDLQEARVLRPLDLRLWVRGILMSTQSILPSIYWCLGPYAVVLVSPPHRPRGHAAMSCCNSPPLEADASTIQPPDY